MPSLKDHFNPVAQGVGLGPEQAPATKAHLPMETELPIASGAPVQPAPPVITLPDELATLFYKDVPQEDMETAISVLTTIYDEQVKPHLPDTKLSMADRLLFVAASSGNINLLKAALEEGADVNSRTEGNESEVFEAVNFAVKRTLG